MRQTTTVVLVGLTAVAGVLAAMGCGDGIQAGEEAELRVHTPVIEIDSDDRGPSDSTYRTTTFGTLDLENTGDGDLDIQSIEWIDRPSRVQAYYDGEISEEQEGTDCQSSADCNGGEAICLSAGNDCRDLGFRDRGPVGAGQHYEQNLIIEHDEQNPVECPEAGDDVPDDYVDEYCGAIEIETNAVTGDEHVDDGTARVYLTSDGGGDMNLPETVLQYTFATWGTTQTEEFVIENNAGEALEIDEMSIANNAGWFEATPARSDVDRVDQLVVDGHGSETITVEMTPPERDDLTEEELEEEEIDVQTSVTFETSSLTPESSMSFQVTSGPGHVPLADVDPAQLSFEDGEPQTLRVQNFGSVPLTVNSMNISPNQVEEHYNITHDGDEVLGESLQIDVSAADEVVPEDNGEDAEPILEPGVEEFEVELTNPEAESTVGELRIQHSDSLADNRSYVTLLGDASEVAVGEIRPRQINFRSNTGGDPETRYLVLSNEGNDDLIVDGLELDPDDLTDADDYTVETADGQEIEDLVVSPGELRELRVSYDGDTEQPQNLVVEFDSNHAGLEQNMRFVVDGQQLAPTAMEISIAPGFPDVAQVDQQTTFAVDDPSGEGRLDQASWFLHDRPAGSEATLDGVGEEISMIPDVAGDYRISVVVDDGGSSEIQEIFEFEATD